MSLILWFTVWLTIPNQGWNAENVSPCDKAWRHNIWWGLWSVFDVTQNLVEIFKDIPSKPVNINPTPHKIHEVEIHRISWRETTRLSLYQCPNIKHVFLLFLILFFCNFHLAEHGDWLIMVQIYERPCGVLQTRGRTQLCCLPRDAISNAHTTNTCSMFKTWSKFWTNSTKKYSGSKKGAKSSGCKEILLGNPKMCTEHGEVMFYYLAIILQKRSLFEAKSLDFFAYRDCSFSCLMGNDCDDDHKKALTGWSCSQCKSPVGWTHDVGVSSLSKV